MNELKQQAQGAAANLKQSLRATDIGEWCKEIIEGAGGFDNYEKYELVVWHISRERAIAEWVIRSLANPENEGSQMVIDSIIERRKAVDRN